jgi:hypothetical protein
MVKHIDALKTTGVLKGANATYFEALILQANNGQIAAAKQLSDSISEGGVFTKDGFKRIARMPIDRLGTADAAKVGFFGGIAKGFTADMQAMLGAGSPAALENTTLVTRAYNGAHGFKADAKIWPNIKPVFKPAL